MKRRLVIALIMFIPITGFTQELFNSAIQESETRGDHGMSVDWGGYIRGTSYVGESSFTDHAVFQSTFAETAVNLRIRKEGFGLAYAEGRLRSGYEYGSDTMQFDLREAWVDLYIKNFDFRIGKQIISWGRGDGFNPSNNITPQNYFVRSPEMDDRNLGNFLMKGRYKVGNAMRLIAIFIPVYKPSVYRFDLFESGENITYTSGQYPEFKITNGSYAFKLEWQLTGLDGSFSYFNGYDPLPGINVKNLLINPDMSYETELCPIAYREQVYATDFSTVIWKYGVRGEAAYRITEGYNDKIYMSNPDIRYVIGIDRTVGDLSMILQYIGNHVFDFEALDGSENMQRDGTNPGITDPEMIENMIREELYNEMERYNRAINNQTVEWGHGISFSLTQLLLYQTLSLKISGYYNFSTGEYVISPEVSYDISDGIGLAVGGQYFNGADETNFGLIAPVLNGGFLEFRYSF